MRDFLQNKNLTAFVRSKRLCLAWPALFGGKRCFPIGSNLPILPWYDTKHHKTGQTIKNQGSQNHGITHAGTFIEGVWMRLGVCWAILSQNIAADRTAVHIILAHGNAFHLGIPLYIQQSAICTKTWMSIPVHDSQQINHHIQPIKPWVVHRCPG